MLSYSGIPKTFWVNDVKTGANFINRCPSSTLQFKTPEQVWSNHPISYVNLNTFGFIAYYYNREDKPTT